MKWLQDHLNLAQDFVKQLKFQDAYSKLLIRCLVWLLDWFFQLILVCKKLISLFSIQDVFCRAF